MKRCGDSIWVKSTQVFGRISMLYAVCLTSGLHGPRVRLIMPNHFEDFEVMSVT